MGNRLAWLAAASVVVMSAVAGVWKYHDLHTPMFMHGEHDESTQGRPPVDGDYWALRLSYAGDVHHLRLEPTWLLDAARQDKRISTAVPSGAKTYQRSPDKAFALDPDAFTLLGPQPLVGEGFGNGNNAGRTNVIL